jgi:TetR/AcrR family tetracycline transcriptional repressor
MVDTSRAPLTREHLISTALRLLDGVGLEGLTVRRLAAELGVQSPALYWHIRSKQELLDGMAQVMIAEGGLGPPREGELWQDWLARRASSYRASVRSHRDGALVVSQVRDLDPSSITIFEQELAAMTRLGLPAELALRTITTLSHYVTGSLLQEQASPPEAAAPAERIAALTGLLGPDSSLLAAIRGGETIVGDDAFHRGVQLIIAGAETELGI